MSVFKKFSPDLIEGTTDYGGNVKIIITKKIGSQLNSGIFTLGSGESLVKDIHENDEVFYVIEGTLTIESEHGEPVIATQGDMVLIPRKKVHYSKNCHDVPVKIFWCNIEP